MADLRQRGIGVSLYVGPGWVFHLSTEDGFQRERAEHRTWRLGFVVAVRRGGGRSEDRCAECHGSGEIKAVRATTYQGAVEEIDALRDFIMALPMKSDEWEAFKTIQHWRIPNPGGQ